MNSKFSRRRYVFLAETYKDSVSGIQLKKKKKMGHGLVGWCIYQHLLGQQTHLKLYWLSVINVNLLILSMKVGYESFD